MALTVAPPALAQPAASPPPPAAARWLCVPDDDVACTVGGSAGHRTCTKDGGAWGACLPGGASVPRAPIDAPESASLHDPRGLFSWRRRSDGLANLGIGMTLFGGLALLAGGTLSGLGASKKSALVVDGAAVAGSGAGLLLAGILFMTLGRTYTPQSARISPYVSGKGGGFQVAF